MHSTRRVVCLCPEGQIVQTLPEDEAVLGVTLLGKELYLLRSTQDPVDQVEVYDVTNYYHLQRHLTVPNCRQFTDMTSCEHSLCLYISDPGVRCVHRLDLEGNSTVWPVGAKPNNLSVNANHSLIVTCRRVRKIKEFCPEGTLLRDVTLPADVINPWHAIQLTSGQFIVCHGNDDDAVKAVCVVSVDGGQTQTVLSHGGQPGSDIGQYNGPVHLAIDDAESVLVADLINRRVTLLSPTLEFIRQVVSAEQVNWLPGRLCLDVERRRLYVTDNEYRDGQLTAGRVVVFTV